METANQKHQANKFPQKASTISVTIVSKIQITDYNVKAEA